MTSVAFALLSAMAYGDSPSHSDKTHDACGLMDEWADHHQASLRLSGVLRQGAEDVWLFDPRCDSLHYHVAVELSSRVKGAGRLNRILRKDKAADVIVEGIFYGPVPYDSIDPALPALLREQFEKGHKRYGKGYDSMIAVTRVIRANKVTRGATHGLLRCGWKWWAL